MSSKLSCDNPDSGDRQGTIRLLQDEPTFSDLLSHNIPLEEEQLDQLFNSTEKKVAQMRLLLAELLEGRPTGPGDSEDQPRNAGRDQ